MLNVSGGTSATTWDPSARLATLRLSADTDASGHAAAPLSAALRTWIGAVSRPFAQLGDGGRLKGVDAEYRS